MNKNDLMNLDVGDQFFVEYEHADEDVTPYYLPYKHKWLTITSRVDSGRRVFYYAKYEARINNNVLIQQDYPMTKMRWFPPDDFKIVRHANAHPFQVAFADDLPDF